jgi:hypothetical protein
MPLIVYQKSWNVAAKENQGCQIILKKITYVEFLTFTVIKALTFYFITGTVKTKKVYEKTLTHNDFPVL